MKLLSKSNFIKRVNQNQIIIEGAQIEDYFKDEYRFMFHLDHSIIQLEGIINLSNIDNVKFKQFDIEKCIIMPQSHYLGISKEKLKLPSDIIGYMYSSSKFACLGIEFLKSSNIINSNFGFEKPEPIVFEISSFLQTEGLNSSESYVYCLFFETGIYSNNIPTSQYNKFPLKILTS